MASTYSQRLLRSTEISRWLAPLVPQMVTMGSDPDRRQQFGASFGKACLRLGGIYPWLAEVLADVPILAGPNIAAGLRESPRDPFGPFAVTTPQAGGHSIRANGNEARIGVDLDLLHALLRLVSPVMGALHSRTSKAILEVLANELERESSLIEEARQREALGNLDPASVVTIALTPEGQGQWKESTHLDLEIGPSPIVLLKAIDAWRTLVVRDGLIPARLEWSNCAIDDEDRLVILGRLAGSTSARPSIQAVVAELPLVQPPEIPESLSTLLGNELQVDPEAGYGIAKSLMALVDPEGWHPALGPLRLLHTIDSAAGRSAKPLQIGLDTLMLVRQLALFRSMADDLGITGSFFMASAPGG
jgi:hypothetical protein